MAYPEHPANRTVRAPPSASGWQDAMILSRVRILTVFDGERYWVQSTRFLYPKDPVLWSLRINGSTMRAFTGCISGLPTTGMHAPTGHGRLSAAFHVTGAPLGGRHFKFGQKLAVKAGKRIVAHAIGNIRNGHISIQQHRRCVLRRMWCTYCIGAIPVKASMSRCRADLLVWATAVRSLTDSSFIY